MCFREPSASALYPLIYLCLSVQSFVYFVLPNIPKILCLCRVPRRSSRRRVRENKTKKWAEQSVWSMVCAIELGLMGPSTITEMTRKSEKKEPKPRSTGRRTKKNGSTSSKTINPIDEGSTLIRHDENRWLIDDKLDKKIKRKDFSQNHQLFPDHQYSLPAASKSKKKSNPAEAHKISYNARNGIVDKKNIVDPLNDIRDWCEKSNFHESKFSNREIDYQSTVCQSSDLSSVADSESEDLPEKPIFKKRMKSSKLVKGGKKSNTIKRINGKRRYSRCKAENTTRSEIIEKRKTSSKISSQKVSKPEICLDIKPKFGVFNSISGPRSLDIYENNWTIKNQPKSDQFNNISEPLPSDIYENNRTIKNQRENGLFNNIPEPLPSDIYKFNRTIKNQSESGIFNNIPEPRPSDIYKFNRTFENQSETGIFNNISEPLPSDIYEMNRTTKNQPESDEFNNIPQPRPLDIYENTRTFKNQPETGLFNNIPEPLPSDIYKFNRTFKNQPEIGLFNNISEPLPSDIYENNRTIKNQPETGKFNNIPEPRPLDIYDFNSTIKNQPKSGIFNNIPEPRPLDIYKFNNTIENQSDSLDIYEMNRTIKNQRKSGIFNNIPEPRPLDIYNSNSTIKNQSESLDIYEMNRTLKNQPESSIFNNIPEPRPLDIYELNRTIKNQTGPLSAVSSSEDSSENEEAAFEDVSENREIDATNRKKSIIDRGKKMQKARVKKISRKRKYDRNQFWSEANKENRKSEKRSCNDELKLSNRYINDKIKREKNEKKSSFNKAKSLSKTNHLENKMTVEIVDPTIDYEDSEDDETLLVNPLTDLPGALIESNDENVEMIDLHPQFNVDFNMNFENDSISATINDCLDREVTSSLEEKIGPSEDRASKTKNSGDISISRKKYVCKNKLYNKQFVNTNEKKKLSSVDRSKKRRSADLIVTSDSNKILSKGNEDRKINNILNNGGIRTRSSMKNCIENESNDENWTAGTVVWGKCMGWWPGLIVNAEDVGMCETEGKKWVFWINEHRISHLREKTQIQHFSVCLRIRMIETLRIKTIKDANYSACLATIKLINDEILKRGPLTKPYHAWVEKYLISHENIDRFILFPYPANIKKRVEELKTSNFSKTEKYKMELNESCEKVTRTRSNSLDKNAMKIHVAFDSGPLPLAEQKPGVITWAKIMGQIWWPAMIIDFRDCGKKEPKFGCQWILWYGDYTLSQVNHQFFIGFEKGVKKMREYVLSSKREIYKKGFIDAAKDYCSQYGYKTDGWKIEDIFDWFEKLNDNDESSMIFRRNVLPGIPGSEETSQKYPPGIIEGLRKHKGNCTVAAIREHNIKDSKTLKSVVEGKTNLDHLCLMCLEYCDKKKEKTTIDHPFFEGSLCEECSEKYIPTIFAYGDDGKCFFCTICAGSDTVVMCDDNDCPRVYCTACLKYLIAPKTYDYILINDPFVCFICQDSPDLMTGGLLKPRFDWKSRVARLFNGNRDSVPNHVQYYNNEKKKIRVLSLFDGIGSGLVVLNKLGIQVEAYYASEIDPDAEIVSSAHFGKQIIRLGDVRSISEKKIQEIAPIHLLIGGSPCNDLSLVNPARLGLHDPNGTGILVFEYERIKNLVEKANGDTHFFWLFENVASMPSKYRLEINQHLGREPDLIDSANYSPQHRPRLYWSNLPIVSSPLSTQDLQDILTPNCNRHALVKKIRTVTTRTNSLKQGKLSLKPILMNAENDSLWITELEEIFGFPRHYTDVRNLCATKRQKLIGKAWSIQTITELMRPLCNFFQAVNQDEP